MTAVLGGFEVTQLKAIGLNSVRATISPAVADRYLQIYSGRRLVGVSEFAGASKVIGQIDPSHCPSPITIVMVAAAERRGGLGHGKEPPGRCDREYIPGRLPAGSVAARAAALT